MTPAPRFAAAVLAALATIITAIPLVQLFDESAWLWPAITGILIMAGVGVLLRRASANAAMVILGQILAGGLYVLVTQLRETTIWGVIPTSETPTLLAERIRNAQETIIEYAAPAPETAGITLALILIIMTVGLAVDMSAATARSPSVAGLPLFSLFLVSAANSDNSLAWGWFLLAAAMWLAMVAHQADLDMLEWATSIPLIGADSGDGQAVAERSLRWQAARLGALCLAIAMLIPALLPHLPARTLLEGLGARPGGTQQAQGFSLSTELDLKRSLESPSDAPVLRYTTDDPTPEPLRVGVVQHFADGFGRVSPQTPELREDFRPPNPVADIAESVVRDQRTLIVADNAVTAPQLALPARVSDVDTGGIAWSLGATGAAAVQRSPGTYTANYTEIDPEEDDFGPSGPRVDELAQGEDYLALDPASALEIRALAYRLAPSSEPNLASAQAFQAYLRGEDFTYDLNLPDNRGGSDDPILSFLETKVGYCQQFATTMTLLARAHGIPARVAVGFLPGESRGDDDLRILASDAHAWPELYFEGVGWTRFEPTPGSRAASVPSYSIASSQDPLATDDPSSTTESTPAPRAAPAPAPTETGPDEEGGLAADRAWGGWLLAALAIAAAMAVMPVTALLARRRHRRAAADDASRIEQEWQDLIERLSDLGVEPPRGATPRMVGQWLGRRADLDESAHGQLEHVVLTLERARYGRPGQQLPDLSDEVGAVVGMVRQQRLRTVRVRALLWPRAGVDAWRALPGRLWAPLRRRAHRR